MSIENAGPFVATIGGSFFAGILIGYALKRVVKLIAIVVGLFFAGLAYLQFLVWITYKYDLSVAGDNTKAFIDASAPAVITAIKANLNEQTDYLEVISRRRKNHIRDPTFDMSYSSNLDVVYIICGDVWKE